MGLAAIEVGDSELAELCVRFFNTYLRAAINRSAPTFASGIMNEYRRFAIGALEWRRDLSVESAAHLLRYGRHFDEAGMPAIFGAAAEDVADLAIEAHVRDPQVSFRLAQLLVRNLLDLIPNARPIGLNGLFKGVAKLTCWSMASEEKDITHVLVEGIAAAPPDFVDAALSRMESMQSGLFWEVNERVISFDWVEQPLRDQIPRLRAALRRAKTGGNGAVIGALLRSRRTWCSRNLRTRPCLLRRLLPNRRVDHRGGGRREVVEQRLAHGGREVKRFHRRGHVSEPGVALGPADRERLVAHAQSRMSALLAVGRRPAPVLDQEQGQPLGRARQIFVRIDTPQDGITGDPRVEALDESPEGRLAARQLVQALVEHAYTCSGDVRSASCCAE